MLKFYESTWEMERDNRYVFQTVCDSEMENLYRVHPLNQQRVASIYKAVHMDTRIAMIVVFGSSLNLRCNTKSDVDVAVKLKDGCISNETKSEISEKIQIACDWKADVLWRDRLSESDRVLHDIRKGVELK